MRSLILASAPARSAGGRDASAKKSPTRKRGLSRFCHATHAGVRRVAEKSGTYQLGFNKVLPSSFQSRAALAEEIGGAEQYGYSVGVKRDQPVSDDPVGGCPAALYELS